MLIAHFFLWGIILIVFIVKGILHSGIPRKTEGEDAVSEVETGADLPWWLPISFLQFRMPVVLILLAGSLFVFVAGFLDLALDEGDPFGRLTHDTSSFPALFFALLLPLVPDLLHETGRLFSRRSIHVARSGPPPRQTTGLTVLGFLLLTMAIGIWERNSWFVMSESDWVRPWKRDSLHLLFFQMVTGSAFCGILVWTTARFLLRFRSLPEEPGSDGKDRLLGTYYLVALLRSFSIPTAIAGLALFARPLVCVLTNESCGRNEIASDFLYGWMVGLHLWMATVPLMLRARKAITGWACFFLLAALAAMPAAVLFG